MEPFNFADDAPRSDPWTEDDFGYRPFAQHLASVLLQLSAPNGYVAGLHGVWGSGKTTALNFVRHFIHAENAKGAGKPLEVVLFQPWMFSGQQDLMSAYFRVLGEKLNDTAGRVKRAKKVAGKMAKATVDPLVKAAMTMAAAAHPSDAAAINTGGAVAKAALEQTIDAWLGEPTLQTAHDELATRLKKSGRRFLVIIDDIDRLEAGEIRSIMQMVKSVGRLPNVIYLLAYDRRIVWRALSERRVARSGEPTFTEKIVQHEVELPHTTRSALLRRLDREMKFILAHVKASGRWREIIQNGVQRWIRSPRDILRFSNAVRFTWPPLVGEVDAADVFAMEGLRLFDPPAFDWVRANRDYLIGGGGYVSDDERKALVDAFRLSLEPSRRDGVMEALAALFPSKSKVLKANERFSYSELWAETVNRRGIASPRGYDAYFALFPSDFAISKALIDRAAAAPDDPKVQDEVLSAALQRRDEFGRSLVGEYLDELQYRMIGREKIQPGKAMVMALLKQGAEIQQQESGGTAFFPPQIQLQFLVREIMKTWDLSTASETMLEAVEQCDRAAIAASIYIWRAREAGRLPAEGAEVGAIITDETLDRIGAHALALVQAEADDGRLSEAPFYWDVIRTWIHLGDAGAAKEWLMSAAETDPHVLAKVAKGVVAMSAGDHGGRVYFFRGFSADRDFYDVERLRIASDRFANHDGLDEDERALVVALRDGLRHAEAGEQAAKVEADAAASAATS